MLAPIANKAAKYGVSGMSAVGLSETIEKDAAHAWRRAQACVSQTKSEKDACEAAASMYRKQSSSETRSLHEGSV